MKIALITTITPASENIRGTSALPYHLMAKRSKDIKVEIFSYNVNQLPQEKIHQVEQELGVRVHLMPLPHWLLWLVRLHLLMLRVFLPLPYLSYLRLPKRMVEEIKNGHPDGIWIYGEEIGGTMAQFAGYSRVLMGPDSEALYYYRMLGERFVVKDWRMYVRQAAMYPKYLRLERSFLSDEKALYCVVGEADAEFVHRMNPQCKIIFLRHPHYEVAQRDGDTVHFHQPIRLLIAGRYDLYMRQSADELIGALCRCGKGTSRESYEVTFLGKGWEELADSMRRAGWNVSHVTFAPNYVEEVMRHDVQLVPISIGTGTKGKVLDALSNGLLVIGTPYAMENVAVEDGVSCIEYRSPERVVEVLADMPHRLPFYEQMAERGRQSVLAVHQRERVSKQFFDLFLSKNYL